MNETIEYQNIYGNRNHKSSLFCMVFKKKEDLLALYNAISGTDYCNPDDLEINTLENAVYLTMKNDISFMIGVTMNLYEHQSSYNPNMPLRGFVYFSQLFNKYVKQHKLNLFSSTLQKIPTPRYVVFYNGIQNEPDRQKLKLSDAFLTEGGCLECEAVMLNINYGHNRELMEKCKRLEEYAIFIATVRKYSADKCISLGEAITLAIDECIGKGILADILLEQKAEVIMYILESFDKELYERDLRDNIRAEVKEEVRAEVKEEVRAEVKEEVRAEVKEEVRAEVKEEVRAEVKKEIEKETMLEIIQKKLLKGKSIKEIADALEEDEEIIEKMIGNLKG